MKNKLLPIGSVVTLKDGEKKLMVTAFYMSEESEPNVLYEYCGCLYPEGMLDSNEYYLFNSEQIETVHFIGFINEEEKEFKLELEKYMSENSNSKIAAENAHVTDLEKLDMPNLVSETIETLSENVSNSDIANNSSNSGNIDIFNI